jgi:DMSO/TMAO reductase YedYZ molybdopterin-dependent catalytic subunit
MNYNNYYEFTTAKTYVAVVAGRHQDFFDGPWSITIDGLVERPMTVDVRELLDLFHMEERVYRHRCVEAWSIVVPWVGFPLYKLLDTVRPLAGAKYVEFQTFFNTSVSEPQRLFSHTYPYPYIEGLTIDEARNELAFLSVGQYQQPLVRASASPPLASVRGRACVCSMRARTERRARTDGRPCSAPWLRRRYRLYAPHDLSGLGSGWCWARLSQPPQSGAPLRLTVPWKYGFKSVKSLVRISFTDVRPVNFWQSLQASEYGFWANVNPEVAHPRWSQASEKELVDSSAGQRIPTQVREL